MLELEELINEIVNKSDYTREEIEKMIEEKQDELSGLVSPEGAAYIVAREIGVTLLEEGTRSMKVKDITPGMFSIDLKCKIAKITDIRTFEKNGIQGAVQNVLLGDETGIIRLSLWNDEIEKAKESGLKEGASVKLSKIIVKEDNLGNPELRLGRKGAIEVIDEDIILPASVNLKAFSGGMEKEATIDELQAGERAKVKGTIVQLFKRKPYFEICAKCSQKVEKVNDKWLCKSCGETEIRFAPIASGIVDDGYGNIRTVFFRENAEKVLGISADDIKKMVDGGKDPMEVYDTTDVIGKRFVISGSVKENSYTGKLEFLANSIEGVEPKEGSEKLIERLEEIKNLDCER